METPTAYIPMDRRQALAQGKTLPDRQHGAALFADISGFTPLTEGLVRELGPQRGAEELTRHLNLVYHSLITELHRYGGSVISFSGDAITCWFDGDSGLRAAACALAMQGAMTLYAQVPTPSGKTVSLAMKAAVAIGSVRRFLVGDPQIQIIDVLAGAVLDHLAAAEHHTDKGEVVLASTAAESLADQVEITEWRQDEETGQRFGLMGHLLDRVATAPWPALPPEALSEDQVRPWLLPAVYRRLHSGQGEFLAELRPAVALFLRFGGIDYDWDDEAGAKLDTYIRQVQSALARYEGRLLQLTIGDKGSYLYAAFGAPLAHEDDAVRAVSAALELRSPGLECITNVQIGISQGRMRTGAYGGTERRTYGVLGDEVNLAARLMQAAVPGQVLVKDVTRHDTGEGFTWESLPPLRVKGKSQAITVFSLANLKERRAIYLQDPDYNLPMVGREAELKLIEDKLALTIQGRGQIIGITAEAGMGKSRLVAEVIRLANERGLIGYGGDCQSYGTNTSYLVWGPIWQAFFGLDSSGELADQVAHLERQLESIDPALVPRLPLLGAVLNLPIPDNDLTRSFDAKLRKTSLEALLVDCLRARAQETPLLLVLEDCHWLDSLSHDLLEAIGRAVSNLPVTIVMAYRPPDVDRLQQPGVSQLPHFTEVGLTDFTPEEAERLIGLKLEQFFGNQVQVPPALIERITGRAQGNPFYIEELLNYLQDKNIDPQDIQALQQLDLPASLHSLILSRIDQLSELQKTTLKVASVIGRLFHAAMLWGVYPQLGDQERIKADLDVLMRMDLTSMDTPEPELVYLFKHIMTQEVAYETLPYATRAMLHDQIGQFIEQSNGDNLDQYVDLLAHHFDRSQNEAKKREYLRKAGESAQAEYANQAAIDYYQRLLPFLPAVEAGDILRKLGDVMQLVGRYSEAGELYQQGLALADELGDQAARAWCQSAMGALRGWKQGQYVEGWDWLERARAGFEELNHQAGVAEVLKIGGTLAAMQGDSEVARARWEESLAIRRKSEDKSAVADLLNNLGIVARWQGDLALARSIHEQALAMRRELRDKSAIAVSLHNLGNVAFDQSNYAEARARLEEAVALQREVGDRHYVANALDSLGNVIRTQGDYEAAYATYRESLTISRALGDKWLLAHLLEDIGCLASLRGESQRALRLVGAAEALREETGAPLSPAAQEKIEAMLETARQALAEPAAAVDEGRAMSLEQAIDYALERN